MTPTERRLAKYSRYNASQKGRDRVERYRGTVLGIFARAQSRVNESIARHGKALDGIRAEIAAFDKRSEK